MTKKGVTSWQHKRTCSLRPKQAGLTYSPLYESVGLISIKLSCPPLPVIRCMASPSCVRVSANGPCPQPDALGPVSPHVGTVPAFTLVLPERRLGRRSLLAGYPASPRDPPHHLSPEQGEGWRVGVASETPSQWRGSRLAEAAGC